MKVHEPADTKRTGSPEASMKLVVWRSGRFWIGHLLDFPAYLTQARTLPGLERNLRHLHRDLDDIESPRSRDDARSRARELAAFLTDWQAMHGPITPEELARAQAELGYRTQA